MSALLKNFPFSLELYVLVPLLFGGTLSLFNWNGGTPDRVHLGLVALALLKTLTAMLTVVQVTSVAEEGIGLSSPDQIG
jgi:hypothetical protein